MQCSRDNQFTCVAASANQWRQRKQNNQSPFHSGCFGLVSSELAKGAIAYRFHSEKLIRSLVY